MVIKVITLTRFIELLKHSNTIKESLLLGSLFLYNLSLGWKFFFLGIIYLFIILAIYNSFYLGIGLVETYFILIEQTIKTIPSKEMGLKHQRILRNLTVVPSTILLAGYQSKLLANVRYCLVPCYMNCFCELGLSYLYIE